MRILKSNERSSLALIFVLITGLNACGNFQGPQFPVGREAQRSLAEEQNLQIIRVNADNIRDVTVSDRTVRDVNLRPVTPPPQGEYIYRVGPGDVLQVNLWDNPERVVPNGGIIPNITVNENGVIFYPYVGEVEVAGQSISQIRTALVEALEDFLQAPQVEISVVEYNAHHATLLGEVGAPGQYPISNVPLTLLDAINAAMPADDANLSRVLIRRGGREYAVDLVSFINEARAGHNPTLLPDDIVIVNPLKRQRVYTFGEIGVAELALDQQDTSLTAVIAQSGGIDRLRANARGVFVFRGKGSLDTSEIDRPTDVTVYQFELNQPAMYLLAQSFQMRDGDVLFVTQEPISRWNDTVAKLLSPVVTTLRAQTVLDGLSND